MALRIFVLFSCLACVCAYGATVRDLSGDADASRGAGDFYRAYRSYLVLEKTKPKFFGALGIEGYLESLFVIGTVEQIRDECDRLTRSEDEAAATKASYICGLHFVKRRNTDVAETYLKRISDKTKFRWPGLILKATVDLLKNEPAQALALLPAADGKQFSKLELEDEFYLCRGRALTMQNKFEEAVKEFQAITSASRFYADALNETAWIFFKMHRFESAHVLLDVVSGNFESGAKGALNLSVSPSAYYRARYLRAYLALVEQRAEGAVNEFMDLKSEYDKYLARNKTDFDYETSLNQIRTQSLTWTDTRGMPQSIQNQIDLIGEWIGAEVAENFKREIFFQMAINRETDRITKNKALLKGDMSYPTQLASLQSASWKNFSTRYTRIIKKVEKSMKTLSLKADVGRLEVIWLGRAQGARNLDEVIDNYGQSIRAIDEFVEPGSN